LTRPQPLNSFFAPRSVAVIGATETSGSVGRTVLTNLLANPFGGAVYPVNPKRASVWACALTHQLPKFRTKSNWL
jgi:acetyltransferase